MATRARSSCDKNVSAKNIHPVERELRPYSVISFAKVRLSAHTVRRILVVEKGLVTEFERRAQSESHHEHAAAILAVVDIALRTPTRPP